MNNWCFVFGKYWTRYPWINRKQYLWPDRNSFIILSLSFWGMSPCIELTVKLASCIFCVSQSTFLLVLQKITAWVMVSVSYKSQRVSNFHSSRSTATKNCLIPSSVNSSLWTCYNLYRYVLCCYKRLPKFIIIFKMYTFLKKFQYRGQK